MDSNYCVYMHENKINKKKYIGITKTSMDKRWGLNGNGYKNNKQPLFSRAIEKYGWDNFDHIVLFENLSKDEACEKEIELIQKYNTQDPQFGYNIQPGGQLGNTGISFSEEAKEKMRQAKIGKQLTEEHKQKISDSLKGHNPCVHTDETKRRLSEINKGKIISEDVKKKISETLTGIKRSEETINKIRNNNPNACPIYCQELNKTFNSINDAERETGIDRRNIQRCLNGIRPSAGKHPITNEKLHWKRIEK